MSDFTSSAIQHDLEEEPPEGSRILPSGTKRKRKKRRKYSSQDSSPALFIDEFSDSDSFYISGSDNALDSDSDMSSSMSRNSRRAIKNERSILLGPFYREFGNDTTQRLLSLLSNPDGPSLALAFEETDPEQRDFKFLPCSPLLGRFPKSKECMSPTSSMPSRTLYGEITTFKLPVENDDRGEPSMTTSSMDFNTSTLPPSVNITWPTEENIPPIRTEPKPPKPILDTSRVPTEIFEHICTFLYHEDVKTMRLVDRAFEKGVSRYLFNTAVVPFNAEIYGILGQIHASSNGGDHSVVRDFESVSQPRAAASSLESSEDYKKSALDMFRGFGPHIQNFGMSFEVYPEELTKPPTKVLHQGHGTFWGTYRWPFPNYRRFQDRAGLEVAADETSMMTLAFSYLQSVKHLAISLDSGLGWMSGPDLSLRAKIFARAPPIFGKSRDSTHASFQGQRNLWEILEEFYKSSGALPAMKTAAIYRTRISLPSKTSAFATDCPQTVLARSTVATSDMVSRNSNRAQDECGQDGKSKSKPTGIRASSASPTKRPSNLRQLMKEHGTEDLLPDWETQKLSTLTTAQTRNLLQALRISSLTGARPHDQRSPDKDDDDDEHRGRRVLCIKPMTRNEECEKSVGALLNPADLTKAQREWLLETAWAQDAFLSSYMLAVADNRMAFEHVTKFSMSNLSSRHLPKLCRDDFWKSLPQLTEVEVHIIADWRDVQKNHAGVAETPAIDPSGAMVSFYHLLHTIISLKKTVHTLSIGWVDGGEHAEGLFARNRLLLPAPITPQPPLDVGDSTFPHMLSLPFVKSFKLVNCWLTPNALTNFVRSHKNAKLCQLILESVSLTTHPRFPANNAGLHAFGMAPQQGVPAAFAQQLGVLPLTQLAQQFQVAGWPLPLQNTQAAANANQAGLANNINNILALMQAQQAPQQGPSGFRAGSWPDVLRELKTWCTRRDTTDLALALYSCGYVRLRNVNFDQSVLDAATLLGNVPQLASAQPTDFFFSKRRNMLQGTVMSSNDLALAAIVTNFPNGEIEALESDWGLTRGWPSGSIISDDYDDGNDYGKWGNKTKEAATFDGLPPGGTGRVSGNVLFGSRKAHLD